jgi:WD40 repeat protein
LSIAFSPDGSRVAVGYHDTTRVTVLDGHTLHELVAPDTRGIANGNVGSVVWSTDGKLLYGGGLWDHDGTISLRAWAEGGWGVARDYPLSQNSIRDLRPVGEWLAVAAADPRLLLIDRSGSVIWQAKPRTADFRTMPHQLLMSADGMRVRFNFDLYPDSGGTRKSPLRISSAAILVLA